LRKSTDTESISVRPILFHHHFLPAEFLGFRIAEARANDVSGFRRLRAVGKRQFSLMPDSRHVLDPDPREYGRLNRRPLFVFGALRPSCTLPLAAAIHLALDDGMATF
jgi:hypothetical protein